MSHIIESNRTTRNQSIHVNTHLSMEPLKSMNDFDEFEYNIVNNEEFRQDFVSTILADIIK